VRSMTGFGFIEEEREEYSVLVDLKSYNNRFLDIQVNLSPQLSRLEPRVREFLAAGVERGRIEAYIRLAVGDEVQYTVDKRVARLYSKMLDELIEEAGITDQVRLSHLLRIEGILRPRRESDPERYWRYLLPHLQAAYQEMNASRVREGGKISRDIEWQLEAVETSLAVIEERKPELKEVILTNLRERFAEMMGGEVDENRVYAEAALLLAKFDINEEIVRMKSHVREFRDLLARESGIGKRLDFICQELNREINTIGSKSAQLDIHSSVIQAKDAVERVREQLRNVE